MAPALVGRRQLDRRPTHTARLYSKRSSRGAVLGVPYITNSLRRVRAEALPALHPSFRRIAAFCRSVHVWETDPVDARRRGLFRENTNLEWMVLVSRKRTPAVESIFRAGLRVRTDRAASASRAATTPRRSPPSPRRSFEGYRAALATPSPKRWPYSVDDHLCSAYLHN